MCGAEHYWTQTHLFPTITRMFRLHANKKEFSTPMPMPNSWCLSSLTHFRDLKIQRLPKPYLPLPNLECSKWPSVLHYLVEIFAFCYKLATKGCHTIDRIWYLSDFAGHIVQFHTFSLWEKLFCILWWWNFKMTGNVIYLHATCLYLSNKQINKRERNFASVFQQLKNPYLEPLWCCF